jgi:hypothetical protein
MTQGQMLVAPVARVPPQLSITEPMKLDSVPTTLRLNHGHEPITGIGKGRLQGAQVAGLFGRHVQSN